MSMEIFQRIRTMAQAAKEKRKDVALDVAYMTAPCGLPCFECYLYLAQFDDSMAEAIAGALNLSPEQVTCRGCRAEDGKQGQLPMDCRVYPCAESKGLSTCAECEDDFPCEYLHPYWDQADKPHNTKVYNLCRIQKVGLERWAREEAGGIWDKYFHGAWTL